MKRGSITLHLRQRKSQNNVLERKNRLQRSSFRRKGKTIDAEYYRILLQRLSVEINENCRIETMNKCFVHNNSNLSSLLVLK